jgi:GxxExxY protein
VRTIEEPSCALDALARETIGAAIEVHRALGPGFLESNYEEALCLELTHRSISFARQVPIPICYRSHPVGTSQLDLMVAGQLVVELKAVPVKQPKVSPSKHGRVFPTSTQVERGSSDPVLALPRLGG